MYLTFVVAWQLLRAEAGFLATYPTSGYTSAALGFLCYLQKVALSLVC